MSEPVRIDRRSFNVAWAYALLGGAAISITGCGSSSPSSPSGSNPPPAAGPGDKSGDVSGNHGHVATVTAAQLSAGGALSLNIRGVSDHPHTVSLSAGEVASIASGTRVSKASSSDDGHAHTVTFN